MKVCISWVFRPPDWVKAIIWISTGVLLVIALSVWGEHSFLAYIAYAFLLHSVVIFALAVQSFAKAAIRWLSRYPICRSYLQSRAFRAKAALYVGTAINLAYAVMKLSAGIYYRSVWFADIGIYNLFLGGLRFFLLWGENRADLERCNRRRRAHKLQIYRFSGALLFLTGLAMGGMTIQMVIQNRSFAYPGVFIYASAAYVFFCFGLSAVNLVIFRDLKSPVLSAAKTVGFSSSLMSLLSLQTAMLTAFGGSPGFNQAINSAAGGIVFF